ncbi:MAG: MaoC/PaaZ C-terminal domain-containing protein [Acetobacterales bacterium]
MAIDYEKLLNREFRDVEEDYSVRDTMLYALGIGIGHDPVDPQQLDFVYEKALKAMPSMASVLGYIGFWAQEPDTGIDWVKVVAGEQGVTLHKPLPPEGRVVGKLRITGIVDKGEGRGALVYSDREVYDRDSGDHLATVSQTMFARGNGGFGGPEGPVKPTHRLPETEPEATCDLPTAPNQALIYRLSGDYNPLHADPAVAGKAGFERPILHGLCTFGVACHAVLKTYCGYAPEKLKSLDCRYSAPVYPGETVRTEMWRAGETVSFRARVVERDVVALNNGKATLAA